MQTWRASPRVTYTGSSSGKVTRFSWISHRRSSTPWTKCSASFAPVRSLETIAPSKHVPPRSGHSPASATGPTADVQEFLVPVRKRRVASALNA
jgi:hypothetical protein